MPVERSYRRFTPHAFAVAPQLLSTVHRYGVELGLELLSVHPQFHWIAEEFLSAPLPPNMAAVKGATLEETYFYNVETMETAWVGHRVSVLECYTCTRCLPHLGFTFIHLFG